MADTNKNKTTAGNLIRSLSAKEIDAFFKSIDDRIIELHECSSEDFLALSADFKKYHASIKELISTACDVLQHSNQDSEPVISKKLTELEKQTKIFIEEVIKKINSSELFINNIFNDKDFLFVPFQNFKQNFQALKLLIANLSLEATTFHLNSKIKISNLDELYKQFEIALLQVEELKTKVSGLIKQAKEVNNIIPNLNKEQWKLIHTGIKQVKKLIAEQKINAEKNKHDIQQLDSQNIESSSTIITNLQYHDIIRQKIEHIQSAHKEAIKSLFEIEQNPKKKDSSDEKADFYIRISDIAGIQAAQLVQANREYQDAINIISEQFRQISRISNQVASKTHQVFNAMPEGTNNNSNINKIKLTFKQIIENFINLGDAIETYTKLSRINNQIYEQFCNINIQIEKLSTQIKICASDIESFKNKFEIKTSAQIIKLIDDINHTTDSIKELVNTIECAKNKQNINEINNDIQGLHKMYQNISDLIYDCENIITQANENAEKHLTNTKELNNNISVSIKQSIANIKYYDFFTKNVNKIINDLNTVNYKIKESFSHHNPNANADNLKHLEQKYTMKSEREIHSALLGNDDKSNNANSADDDNLELF